MVPCLWLYRPCLSSLWRLERISCGLREGRFGYTSSLLGLESSVHFVFFLLLLLRSLEWLGLAA